MTDSDKKTDTAEKSQPPNASPQWPTDLSRSSSSLHASTFSYSPSHLSVKEPTPSIASDISLPIATQELRQRLRQLEKYAVNYFFPQYFSELIYKKCHQCSQKRECLVCISGIFFPVAVWAWRLKISHWDFLLPPVPQLDILQPGVTSLWQWSPR